MKIRLFTTELLTALCAASFCAAPIASGQAVRRDTVPRATQRPVTTYASSADSLVECSPAAAPAKRKPAARPRRVVTRARKPAAVKPQIKKPVTPQVKAAVKPRRPLVRRVRRAVPKAIPRAVKPVVAHSTTIVMCRPVRPLAPLAQGAPVEESVVPVPKLAAVPPVVVPVEEAPPLFVTTAPGAPIMTAGGGHSWLPFAIIPAVFIPFIHTGGTNSGTPSSPLLPPITPANPILPPGVPPGVPPIVPPTTVPEPSSMALLSTGLIGLGAVLRKRKKK